jgi:hypothetical protein
MWSVPTSLARSIQTCLCTNITKWIMDQIWTRAACLRHDTTGYLLVQILQSKRVNKAWTPLCVVFKRSENTPSPHLTLNLSVSVFLLVSLQCGAKLCPVMAVAIELRTAVDAGSVGFISNDYRATEATKSTPSHLFPLQLLCLPAQRTPLYSPPAILFTRKFVVAGAFGWFT